MKKRLEEVGSLPITKIPWEYVFLGPKMLTFISRARDRPVYHPLNSGYMAQLKVHSKPNSVDTKMTYFHGKMSWILEWYDFTGTFVMHALVLVMSL